MTTRYVRTKIEKIFILSSYEHGMHRVKGHVNNGKASFKESLSPLTSMIDAFKFLPLGSKIKVTMEEIL